MNGWKNFSGERPGLGVYWFRIPPFNFNNESVSIEFVMKTSLHGMGHSTPEIWPGFSSWNGYRRSVPSGTQWKECEKGEKDGLFIITSANFNECPFCGKHVLLSYAPRWIGAPPFKAEYYSIQCSGCGIPRINRFTSILRAEAAWNRRAMPEEVRP
jgi:hypothetical protein